MVVEEVLAALRSMPPQSDLVARGLILTYDEDADEQIANVALVLDCDEGVDKATQAWDFPRSAAWDALSSLSVIPSLLCRTRAEHEGFSKSEPRGLRSSMATAVSPASAVARRVMLVGCDGSQPAWAAVNSWSIRTGPTSARRAAAIPPITQVRPAPALRHFRLWTRPSGPPNSPTLLTPWPRSSS